MRRLTGWFEPGNDNPFSKTSLAPGEFYPRISRPVDQHPYDALGWNPSVNRYVNELAVARSQLNVLWRQLDRVCQTVHPIAKNFDTFGHDIRNLLILACTEVEAQWRAVLRANGYDRERLTTSDYVLLRDVLALETFSVRFPNFPWLDPIAPFRNWGTSNPTKTLEWYDAYNAAKHSREIEFERASLRHVFEAVAANVVMVAAQFGLSGALPPQSELRAAFALSEVPMWPPADVYILPYDNAEGTWTAVNFDFANAIPRRASAQPRY